MDSTLPTLYTLRTLRTLRNRLAKVEADIRDMPTSYSQSNPSYVLGMRSLKRMRERLLDAIKHEEILAKAQAAAEVKLDD